MVHFFWHTLVTQSRYKQWTNFSHTHFCRSESSTSIPDKWDLYVKSADPNANFQLCPVDEATDEYRQIYQRFNKNMPSSCYKVETIVRVQNIDLWEDYCR